MWNIRPEIRSAVQALRDTYGSREIKTTGITFTTHFTIHEPTPCAYTFTVTVTLDGEDTERTLACNGNTEGDAVRAWHDFLRRGSFGEILARTD